jgi:hypothetical protein
MLIDPRRESGFRQLEPNKNIRKQKENLRWDSRKVITNEVEEDKIYLKSLVLVRHLRIEARKVDELGFESGQRL